MSQTPKPSLSGGRRRAVKPKSKKTARTLGLLVGTAVAVTGIAVAGGVLGQSAGDLGTPAANVGAAVDMSVDGDPKATTERDASLSRSDRRAAVDPAKRAGLAPGKPAAVSEREQLSKSDPKDIAKALMPEYGFKVSEFSCLDSLWIRESNWNPLAHNPSSGAHGIPQSLPGSKMASEGADWYDNPVTQIKWGLGYIKARYGTPCSAWGHSQSHGWY